MENQTPVKGSPEAPVSATASASQSAKPENSKEAGTTTTFLNIKVTSPTTELFFKLKPSTSLEKLMSAYYSRTNAQTGTLRFLFDGQRIMPSDTPSHLEMVDGDTIEVHTEQIGGRC